MLLQLVFDDEWFIPVRVDARLEEALEVQRARASQDDVVDALAGRLAACVASAIANCLDADLHMPSQAQLKYAEDIARELGIALPAESLRYKGATSDFIDRFHQSFLERRARLRGEFIETLPDLIRTDRPPNG